MKNVKALQLFSNGYSRLDYVFNCFASEDYDKISDILNNVDSVNDSYGKVFKLSFDELVVDSTIEDVLDEDIYYIDSKNFESKPFSQTLLALHEMVEGLEGLQDKEFLALQENDVFVEDSRYIILQNLKEFSKNYKNAIKELVGGIQYNLIAEGAEKLYKETYTN